MAHILLVDDQSAMRLTLTALLKQSGHTLMQSATGADALEKLQKNAFDVVITDLKLDEIGGMDILRAAKASSPQTEVIMLTGYGSVESAVEAMKSGAIDYLTKPVDSEELKLAVGRATERQRLKSEVARLRSAVETEQKFDPGRIVASSQAMTDVLEMVRRVAPTDVTVLVQGESGTGKELIARAIHQNSKRADETFIPINCGALPENLLESELFGHVKGAFTGAHQNKKGLFEEADGGTLFLDEIGETSPATQVKLLRVLQEQEVRRVGTNNNVKINVRVIAATNRKLQEQIQEGTFREDLYYRLNVVPIFLPPLRERREEILPLAQHYLQICAGKFNKNLKGFTSEAESALMEYSWPGNIRELINAIERAVILCRDDIVRPDDFALTLGGTLLADAVRDGASSATFSVNGNEREGTSREGASRSLQEIERELLTTALEQHGGQPNAAARALGITPTIFSRKVKEYRL